MSVFSLLFGAEAHSRQLIHFFKFILFYFFGGREVTRFIFIYF